MMEGTTVVEGAEVAAGVNKRIEILIIHMATIAKVHLRL